MRLGQYLCNKYNITCKELYYASDYTLFNVAMDWCAEFSDEEMEKQIDFIAVFREMVRRGEVLDQIRKLTDEN